MLDIFRRNTPPALFFSILIAVLLLLPGFWTLPEYPFPAAKMSLILPLMQRLLPSVDVFISFFLLIATVIYSNFVVNKHRLFANENRYPGLFIAVFIALGSAFYLQSVFPLCALLLMRFYDRCFEIQKSSYPNSLVFDASFITGLLGLIYLPFLLLLLVIWIAILYSKRIGIKPFVLSLVTIGIVLYLAMGVFFLFDLPYKLPVLTVLETSVQLEWSAKVGLIVLAITLLLSIPFFLETLANNKVVIKSHFTLILWSSIPLGLIALSNLQNLNSFYTLMSFPMAILLSNMVFKMKKRFFANFILILFFVLALGHHYLKL